MHFEFFENINFKWVNERPLDIAHMYLLLLLVLHVSKISTYRDYAIYIISIIQYYDQCDTYSILVYVVMFISYLILYGHFCDRIPCRGLFF